MAKQSNNHAKLNFIGEINPSPDRPGFLIQLDPALAQGLLGLADFSHAQILWWADQADSTAERQALICEKPYRNSKDDVGVFGSRSPGRPNPIGLSVIQIASIDAKAGSIFTYFIDTEPGTPVVDIKPYFPASDRVTQASTPGWCQHWPSSLEESATFDWAQEFE